MSSAQIVFNAPDLSCMIQSFLSYGEDYIFSRLNKTAYENNLEWYINQTTLVVQSFANERQRDVWYERLKKYFFFPFFLKQRYFISPCGQDCFCQKLPPKLNKSE